VTSNNGSEFQAYEDSPDGTERERPLDRIGEVRDPLRCRMRRSNRRNS